MWGKAVALSRYQQNQVLIWNRRTPGQLPTDPGYQSATTVAAGRLIAGAVGLAGAFFEPCRGFSPPPQNRRQTGGALRPGRLDRAGDQGRRKKLRPLVTVNMGGAGFSPVGCVDFNLTVPTFDAISSCIAIRDKTMKPTVYFDTCIESGRVQTDLPPAEMSAVGALEKAEGEGKIEIITSRETHREQDKANPLVRARLVQSRGQTPVVPKDHTLLGMHNQMDRLGTVSTTPIISDIVDDALFKSLIAAGLKEADAHHLMYAAHNGCDRFVTTDRHFTSSFRRSRLEALCQGLKIVTPSELAAELSLDAGDQQPASA